jgi:hypothetical protein
MGGSQSASRFSLCTRRSVLREHPDYLGGVQTDVRIYTPEELERISSRPFIRSASEERITIYGRLTNQQAAEKAVKSVWHLRGGDPWGHSVQRLSAELEGFDAELFRIRGDLLPEGSKLDKYYIPTRYPNGLPDLVPDATPAIDSAFVLREEILVARVYAERKFRRPRRAFLSLKDPPLDVQ